MRKERIIGFLALAGGLLICAPTIQAQEENEMQGPDLTGEFSSESVSREDLRNEAANSIGTQGEANWYVTMDYGGFEFELPAGTLMDKGSSLVAKYPDGSFGLSMTNEHMQAANQKTAYEVCTRLGEAFGLPKSQVEKVKYGRCGGAKAWGNIEGQKVVVLVLPYANEQVSTVIIANPEREEWLNHFLDSLKR